MREAAAQGRTKQKRAREGRAWGRLLGRFIRMITRRPTRVITIALIIAVVVAFLFNALVLQAGRHPAPLFANAPAQTAEPSVLPPLRPLERPVESAAVPVPPNDPIAGLIRGGDPLKDVMFAQRALNKLGYGPLKADGLYGTGTKLAIEKFARDRKMPVSSEINRKMLAELAAASGLSMD